MEELVSVIIPTYNRAYTIQDSIMSVLNQTYKNIEVLIIDDGSTDNTENKVKEIRDKRVQYYKQNNKGACAARNIGILLANGRYIAFNDSDDIWYDYKIEHQVSALQRNNADIVFGKLDNKKYKKSIPDHIREGFLQPNVDLSGIGTQAILGKKEIFNKNLFNENLPRFQELELLIRLHSHYSIYCLNEKVVEWRIQQDSISKDIHKMYAAAKLILEEDGVYLNKIPKTKGTILGYLGTCKAYQGVNDSRLFKEAYVLKGRKLDMVKMIMTKLGLLTLYYKRLK